MKKFKILSPTAILGYGFPESSFNRGMDYHPDLIAVDAGSTDPGPFYLGSGKSFTDRSGVKRDLKIILKSALNKNIPVIIGTAGGSGAHPHLNRTKEIIEEISKEENLSFSLALIPSDISPDFINKKIKDNQITPLDHNTLLTSTIIENTPYIVGQIGTESFQKALKLKPQVILAGRAYDPAVFAALPIEKGFDRALAIHLGKILECAAIAATPGSGSDCALGILYENSFELIPLNKDRFYTHDSVAAHSLYEKSDPYHLPGPGGSLDLTNCSFEEIGQGKVKVSGTRFIPSPVYTIKLEGCSIAGYRTISIAGIRDPMMISQLDTILNDVKERTSMILEQENIENQVYFHVYGRDGVMGKLEPCRDVNPKEVGLVIDVVASSQEKADTVCSIIRSTLLHYGYPGRISTAGNLAFPFSPSDLSGGPVYEFSIYHLMEITPQECDTLFQVKLIQINDDINRGKRHE